MPMYCMVPVLSCFVSNAGSPRAEVWPLKLSSSNIPQKEPFSHGTSSISVFEALRYLKDIEISVFQA